MTTSPVHFPLTTPGQRRLLFETWESTDSVTGACRKAHVGRGTFYDWKPRFQSGGYPALEAFANRAPLKPRRTPTEIEAQVIAIRQTYPQWGKRRIADELAKGNNWIPLVSPNTVRRILTAAALWPKPTASTKKGGPQPMLAPPLSPASR